MPNNKIHVLAPGAVIGIFGGGQLGRMLALAAARLGFKTHIFAPEADGPAMQCAWRHTQADYSDHEAVRAFAGSVDVITYEFENIPTETVTEASVVAPVFPPVEALYNGQDRLTEKTFISETAEVPVAPFMAVNNEFDAKRALKVLGGKCVIKTRRMGYDGKGQVIAASEDEAMAGAKALGSVPCIAEGFIPFRREVSIICARNTAGEVTAYPLIANEHRNHILHRSTCPADGDNGQAKELAFKILKALDYIGVLAVEFFELEDGTLLVNEIAPRVHNSGHWTQDAGCTDQFEMHIRAIAGWPLGNSLPKFKVEMTNLLGDDVLSLPNYVADPDVKIHLYGKTEARAGRKMGHINKVMP